jgi:hypothetical protein
LRPCARGRACTPGGYRHARRRRDARRSNRTSGSRWQTPGPNRPPRSRSSDAFCAASPTISAGERSAPAERRAHPAEILVRETVRKQRRALVVYGGLRLIRQNGAGPNLVEHAERAGARAFVLLTHPGASLDALGVDHASWPVPAIALTRGSSLANQADAVLYLGRASGRTVSRLSASLCADARYREMRVRRMTLAGAPDPAAQLEKECWRE